MADITKINLNGTELTIVDSAATSAIAGEIARAQGAESAITSALSAEVVARQSADTQIQTALSGKADASTTISGYGITDAYTKTETDNAITAATSGLQATLTPGTGIEITSGNVINCTIDTGLYVVVQELPAQPAAGNENKIHLVLDPSGVTGNEYIEYLWKGDEWEEIGKTTVETDLSGYWTSAQTQSAITSATSGLASTQYVDSAITDALGAGVVEEGGVESVFASAGIVGYETDDETGNEVMVVNSMATEGWIEDFVGGSLIEALGPGTAEENTNTIEDIFLQSNIATIEFDDKLEKDVVIVKPMATQGYIPTVANAEYNAQTETLILNLPAPPSE